VHKHTFNGGIHPPEEKHFTENKSFEIMAPPAQIILPLVQHLGKQAKAIVKKGSEVKKGTLVAESDGFISSPVHSSISGTVAGIVKEVNSSGFPKDSIIINSNSRDDTELFEPLSTGTVSPEEIRERVRLAGIVGQGVQHFQRT
jgi:Na+-translocating ferredoxin:NAD+ oxidoreductase subunit C